MAAVISMDAGGGGGAAATRPWGPVVAVASAATLLAWAVSLLLGQHDRTAGPSPLAGEVTVVDAPSGLRSRPTTVALGDGRVLVWGGVGALPGTGEVYDPRVDAWRSLPDPPGPVRAGATGVWTGDEVVIAGGWSVASGPELSVSAWSPATDTWRELPPAPFDLRHARGVAVAGGVIFADVGAIEASHPPAALWLDLATGRWTSIAAPIRTSHLTVDGSTVLAVGALDPPLDSGSPGPSGVPHWAVLRFDPVTFGWEPVGVPFAARWATVASDGGVVSLVALPELNAPLTAYELRPDGWQVAATSHEAAHLIRAIEIVGYPPAALWTGAEHLVGGTGGLAAWAPGDDEFRIVRDMRLSVFGATAVWAGDRAVALANQETEGWTWTPAPSVDVSSHHGSEERR